MNSVLNKIKLLLVCSVVVSCASKKAKVPEGDSETIYKFASEQLSSYSGEREKLELAEKALQRVLQKDPLHAKSYLKMADLALEYGYINGQNYHKESVDKALGLIEKAQSIEPELVDALFSKSRVYRYQNKADQALKELEKASSLLKKRDEDPLKNYFYRSGRGQIFLSQNKLNESLKELQSALELAKNYNIEKTHTSLAMVYSLLKDYPKAIVHSKEVVKRREKSAWAWYNLAHAYGGNQQFEEAIESGEKALQIREFPAVKTLLSRHYLEKARKDIGTKSYDSAGRMTEKSLKITPNNFYSNFWHARVLKANKKFEEAYHYFKKSYVLTDKQVQKDNPGIVAFTFYELGYYNCWVAKPRKFGDAIGFFQKSLKAAEKENNEKLQLKNWVGLGTSYHNIGWAEKSISDTERAIYYYKKVLRKDSSLKFVRENLRKAIINLRNFKRQTIAS